MDKTILVTGASGFIAGHCIIELLRHGYRVRGTVRDKASAPALCETLARYHEAARDIDFAEADLTDPKRWHQAVEGCDGILHVASPVPLIQPKNADAVIRPAREGTLNLLAAAKHHGVKRVVMTSSIAAVTGSDRSAGCYTAADWTDLTDPRLSPYARSKTIAERAAWDFVAEHGGPELATINPALVLGPTLAIDYGSSLEALVKLLRGDVPLLPRLGFDIVDVRDVASLHRLALEADGAAGNRYLCANGFLWLTDVARILRSDFPAFGKRIPVRTMPDFLVRVAAVFIREIAQFVDDVGKVKQLDSSPALAIGWQPRSAEAAVHDGAQSLLALGVVHPPH